MPPARPWPAVLEERLRATHPGVEVIDAACPGYDSSQARSWYEDEIDGWEHDALVVYIGWNDVAQLHPDGLAFKLEEHGYLAEPSLLQRAVSASYLLRSFYVVQGFWEKRGEVDRSPLSGDEKVRYEGFRPVHYEENLAAIASRALASGRPVFVLGLAGLIHEGASADEEARMNFPRGMGKKIARLVAVERAYRAAQARVRGATFVDLEPLFADEESRRSFTDRCHFDARGAERIGARVADAVAPLVSR
jgi:lysophospholipase L1-like esterase